MKADLRSGDGPEREGLRSILRQWDVPAPPPEIEEDLRRTFGRRRAKGRPVLWLTLAAAAVLAALAVWRVEVGERAATPASPERPVAAATPIRPTPTAEPARSRHPDSVMAFPVQRPRRPDPAPREAEVVVEPGQGRLLAELEGKLRGVRQAAPGTSIPWIADGPADQPATIGAAEAADVPRYEGEWETVEAEWPYVHRSRPTGGR